MRKGKCLRFFGEFSTGSFHGRRNDFIAMGTPETGDGVWVWPGVDKLPKDIGQMGGGFYGKSMTCMQKIYGKPCKSGY
jgi:hypothetical protein